MQPVVELKARIAQIRNIERGESVGYGGTWTARGRPGRDRLGRLCDGYFAPAAVTTHPRRRRDGRGQTLPGGRPHLDGPDGGRYHRSPHNTRGVVTW